MHFMRIVYKSITLKVLGRDQNLTSLIRGIRIGGRLRVLRRKNERLKVFRTKKWRDRDFFHEKTFSWINMYNPNEIYCENTPAGPVLSNMNWDFFLRKTSRHEWTPQVLSWASSSPSSLQVQSQKIFKSRRSRVKDRVQRLTP